MSQSFFEDLGIPSPDVNLGVGSGSHAQQSALIMMRFEPVLLKVNPDVVIVVGDVNSTLACTLVASKLGIKVAHVEAGLRSFDRTMPEELNRIVTDQLSDLLFVTEKSGVENLEREGIGKDKIFLVGNLMVDTLVTHKSLADERRTHERLGLESGEYAVVTMHRPSNVDDDEALSDLVETLTEVSQTVPIAFPIHPRTRKRLDNIGILKKFESDENIRVIQPLGYLDFLALTSKAKLILTDSGGLQEEACILEVPCITLRENTERPITIESGWSVLTGADREQILHAVQRVMLNKFQGRPIPQWDGEAAGRIIDILVRAIKL
jgi:UDP-N-acetylglucosamine 2-epimerase (non-hydrolysing)